VSKARRQTGDRFRLANTIPIAHPRHSAACHLIFYGFAGLNPTSLSWRQYETCLPLMRNAGGCHEIFIERWIRQSRIESREPPLLANRAAKLNSTTVQDGSQPSASTPRAHFKEHWYGKVEQSSTPVEKNGFRLEQVHFHSEESDK
jgi:hypothetical protein